MFIKKLTSDQHILLKPCQRSARFSGMFISLIDERSTDSIKTKLKVRCRHNMYVYVSNSQVINRFQ